MKRASHLLVVCVAASCGGKTKWRATPEQMSPLAPIPTLATTVGPLSIDTPPPETSWSDRQAFSRLTGDRYLDAMRIRDEARMFLEVVDTFYKPFNSETKIGQQQVHQSVATLDRLAPYSMSGVTLAYQQSSQRLNMCILNAGMMASCDRDRARTSRPTPTPHAHEIRPYEIRLAEPVIPLLVVRSLRAGATAPEWRNFTADINRALADARGLIIDLRDASGNDPRALLPFVAKLAGRSELRPLRAIDRAANADRYVAAYAARFTDRGRDPEIWRGLVGESTAATPRRPTRPITILVGRHCHSACEVIARSLVTYANATMIGGAPRAGRAGRDEPALLYLPHSQTTVYFHATRYVFATEIEAATGPSEEWSAVVDGDGFDDVVVKTPSTTPSTGDLFSFAVRDVKHRIDHPEGWPRCDALPATKQVPGTQFLAQGTHSCSGGVSIRITANAPNSVLRRFLATCSPPVQLTSYVGAQSWHQAATKDPTLVSKIASSELVREVQVDCEQRSYVN